ncbi:MAG: CvpA family protein [Planctomycetes bacterium]|nr:CvpA family protein [Planctomycetota bacterium]
MRELLAELSWIDLTALAVVIVFFVLGLFRGMVWQISRVATLLVAYVLSGWFGPRLANVTSGWFPDGTAEQVPQYVAYFLIFLVALILFSLLAGILHRVVQQSSLSFYNRVGGGILGVATGWLIVMALLTGVQMAHGTVGFGSSIAEAAASSRSSEVSDAVLRTTGRALPDDWREFTDEWRDLIRGGAENAGEAPPTSPESDR